jgi:hypothetical protein
MIAATFYAFLLATTLFLLSWYLHRVFGVYAHAISANKRRALLRSKREGRDKSQNIIWATGLKTVLVVLGLVVVECAIFYHWLWAAANDGKVPFIYLPLFFVGAPLIVAIPIGHGTLAILGRRAFSVGRRMRLNALLVAILVACASGVMIPAALLYGSVFLTNLSAHLPQFLDDAISFLFYGARMVVIAYLILFLPIHANAKLLEAIRFKKRGAYSAPRTALRNSRVRSCEGLVNMVSGSVSSRTTP